jgi:hypothetical protein
MASGWPVADTDAASLGFCCLYELFDPARAARNLD